jgi:hypothetical protein
MDMSWQSALWINLAASLLLLAAGYCAFWWFWRRRSASIRGELTRLSEDMTQMIELQAEVYCKVRRSLTDIEERITGLTVPSSDEALPLERRYQVLALARKGVPVEEISSRLNVPRGEADLILQLRRYMDANVSSSGHCGSVHGAAQR